jgi:hypothetical protein
MPTSEALVQREQKPLGLGLSASHHPVIPSASRGIPLRNLTAQERFCWCRDLLLRCRAEIRGHRRSPDSARKGWSQIQAYSEPECHTGDRLWSFALPAKPRPLAARSLPWSPVEEAAGLDCRAVLPALLARSDNAPPDDVPVAHYPRMRQEQSQQDTRATVSIS